MLKLHLLGHVHVTEGERTVQVSAKSAALLTYLALEEQAYHREHLADLLWDHPQALRNLRVELARLKQQGLQPFVPRQPMLSLRCHTDLHDLLAAAPDLDDRQLPTWLSGLRGTPLSGLEDLGSTGFGAWVDTHRLRISEQIEAVLCALQRRYAESGQTHLGDQIRQKADRLGLSLPDAGMATPDVPGAESAEAPPDGEPPGWKPHFTFPHAERELRRLLAQARQAPQVALLRAAGGLKHDLVDSAARGTGWQVIHVQGSGPRRLVQAAVLQQLAHLHARTRPGPPDPRLRPTGDPDADLVRTADYLAEMNLPLVLALHGLRDAEPWLTGDLRFLLDARVPLLAVLCSSSAVVLGELRQRLGNVPWQRLHDLYVPPVGAQVTAQALEPHPRWAVRSADERYSHAARLAQHSEGWPLHLSLLERGQEAGQGALGHTWRQPEAVSAALLSALHTLSEPVRRGLHRLAQLSDRFQPDLARLVLGEDAPDVLRTATRLNLLLPAPLNEDVYLPGLHTRTSDRETALGFASEPLRVALASRLPSSERHALRRELAEAYLERNPALAALYADRADLPDLAARARARLIHLPPAEIHALPAERVQLPGGPVPDHRSLDLRACPRHEVRTANGYRVALDNGDLEILRRGRAGSPPTLTLHLGEVAAGTWQMTVRADVLHSPLDAEQSGSYAIGLHVNGVARVVYAPRPIPVADCPGPCLGLLPLGQWVRLRGYAPSGALTLTTRAAHLALTVSSFTWGGQALIPPGSRGLEQLTE